MVGKKYLEALCRPLLTADAVYAPEWHIQSVSRFQSQEKIHERQRRYNTPTVKSVNREPAKNYVSVWKELNFQIYWHRGLWHSRSFTVPVVQSKYSLTPKKLLQKVFQLILLGFSVLYDILKVYQNRSLIKIFFQDAVQDGHRNLQMAISV